MDAAVIPLLLTLLPLAPGEGPYDPDRQYAARRSEPVRYAVDLCVIVTAPLGTKKLKVWLPVPPSDFGQEVSPGEVTTFPGAAEGRQLGRDQPHVGGRIRRRPPAFPRPASSGASATGGRPQARPQCRLAASAESQSVSGRWGASRGGPSGSANAPHPTASSAAASANRSTATARPSGRTARRTTAPVENAGAA